MNEAQINSYLNESIKIIIVEETTSTNDELKKLALSGERNDILLSLKDRQQAEAERGEAFSHPRTQVYI